MPSKKRKSVKTNLGDERSADPVELLSQVRGEVANDMRPKKKGVVISNGDVE
jgi:hypothetical protein